MLSEGKENKEEIVEMTDRRKITFLIKVMNGGGAERVVSLLTKAMIQRGYLVNLILTHQKKVEADLREIDNRISVFSLEDEMVHYPNHKVKANLRMLYARGLGKIRRVEESSIHKYYARNYNKIRWLKEYFDIHRTDIVVPFLYDSIFLTLLSKNSHNKVVISERSDPQQSVKSKTTMAFLHREFSKADHIVFQSPDVSKWYFENMKVNGTVIFNPIKADLPERCIGERKKRIVNFCRISKEKNLELLVKAFLKLYKEYPEYTLYIYGNTVNENTKEYKDEIKALIDELGLDKKVFLLPGRKDIHTEIRDYGMYVSSSDFEGMSNSMLEAMAIGLPVVCTDCPAGGARAVIRDYENGLLVPVGDEEKMYLAMKDLIEKPELADKLSQNAVQIREEQSLDKIIEKWMEIIND